MKKIFILVLIIVLSQSCGSMEKKDSHTVKAIFSADNRGELDPCGCRIPTGGLPRKAGYIRAMENMYDHVLKLEGGNWLFPAFNAPGTAPAKWKGAADLQALAYADLKYDVINVGHTDLSFGLSYLDSLEKALKLPLISTNITDEDGNPVFAPYKILRINNVNIAVMGVTHLLGEHAAYVRLSKIDDSIRKQLPKIRKQADMIILLADVPDIVMEDIAKSFQEIDFIMNSRLRIRTQMPRKSSGNALYVALGNEGQNLGILNISKTDNSSKITDVSTPYQRLHFIETRLNEYKNRAGETPLHEYYKDNPGLLNTIKRYESEFVRQQGIFDTTSNKMYWEMKALDPDVVSDRKWDDAVAKFLADQGN